MSSERVVNICFHGIGVPLRALEPGEDSYWITKDSYLAILDELVTWPSVQISFDDGNVSDVQIGLPALRDRGLDAQFFALAGRVDEPGSVTAEDIHELCAAGMTIGSHGMWHRSWRGLDREQTRAELDTARQELAAVAGQPVDIAACPLGLYDRRLLTDLRERGYRTVYTSDRRTAHTGDWLQPRYSVRGEHTPQTLRDEVFGPQPLARKARGVAVGVVKRWR